MKTTAAPLPLLVLSVWFVIQQCPSQEVAILDPQTAPQSFDEQPASWRQLPNSESATLGQVRSLFLCQSVIIGGALENLNDRRQLLEWRVVANPNARTAMACSGGPAVQKALGPVPRLVPDDLNGLPPSYSGKTARVIAVQLHNPEESGARTNALGEAISDDEMINPYFDLVVRFDDGTVAATTQYPETLTGGSALELASLENATAEQMKAELPAFVGRTVYAVGYSRLYLPDASLDELCEQDAFKRVSPTEIPLLEPLKIVAAKYVESAGVVTEVELPNGRKALSLLHQGPNLMPLWEKLSSRLFLKKLSVFCWRKSQAR